jgi:hypothetical protein
MPKINIETNTITSKDYSQIRVRKVSSVNEIIAWLVDVRVRTIYPDYNERKFVAGKLDISESELSGVINGDKKLSINQLLALIYIAHAPDVFLMLRELTFPELTVEKR